MRSLAQILLCLAVLFSPSLALAEGEQASNTVIRDELKSLSRKVDELKTQNKAIQETQAQILKEIEVLKVRIHRKS